MQNFGENLKRYRKEAKISQDELAARMGITPQAVSKWECGLSYPDITLIIPIAELFGITADELLRGVGTAKEISSVIDENETVTDEVPEVKPNAERLTGEYIEDDEGILADDGVVRIVMCEGRRVLSAEEAAKREPILIKIEKERKSDHEWKLELSVYGNAEVDGDVNGPLAAGGYVTCGDVNGCTNAGGSVSCGDVNGYVNAGGSMSCGDVNGCTNAGGRVSCGDVNGNVTAGGSVECGDVEGYVNAGGYVNCGNVEGNVSAGSSVTCGDVEGDVDAGGEVTCDDVEGDITAGDDVTCDEVDGDVSAGGNVTCDTVEGDVTAVSVTCDRIEGDVVCEGNDLVVTGTVEGDVKANNVTCQKIEGDVEAETVNYVE